MKTKGKRPGRVRGGRKASIDINELRSFAAAYEAKGERQSKLVARVRRLEKRFDISLLRQEDSTFTLTRRGERLYWHAKQVLALLDQTQRILGKNPKAAQS